MSNIKFFLLISFSFLILSCDDCLNTHFSVLDDKRCLIDIHNQRLKISQETGVCDPKPEHAKKICVHKKGVYTGGVLGVVYCSSNLNLKEYKKSEIDLKIPIGDYYKTLDKCREFWRETDRLCASLPPPGPDDLIPLSGSATYKDGKLVAVDGEPVCN